MINFPFISIPIREQSDYASDIVCVVKTIAAYLVLEDKFKLFHKNLLEIGSTPADGSSKNIIFGFAIIDMETANFLLFPPLRLPAFVLM